MPARLLTVTSLRISRLLGFWNATIDPSTNFTGFNASRLSFTADSVALNLQSLEPLAAGQQVVIDLSFFSSPLTPLLPPGAPINAVNVAGGIDKFSPTMAAPCRRALPTSSKSCRLPARQRADATRRRGRDRRREGAFELMNEFLGLMLDPFVDGRGGAACGGGSSALRRISRQAFRRMSRLPMRRILKAPPRQGVDQRWTVWGAGFGGSGTANGDPMSARTMSPPRPTALPPAPTITSRRDTVLGFALAGAGTNWSLAQSLGTGRSDAFQAGVYGTRAISGRLISPPRSPSPTTGSPPTASRCGDQLTAKFNGQSFGARVESGYRFAVAPCGRRDALCGDPGAVFPHAELQRDRSHRRRLRADLQRHERDRYAQRTRRALRRADRLVRHAGAPARAACLGA